jgi:hypothetical protein
MPGSRAGSSPAGPARTTRLHLTVQKFRRLSALWVALSQPGGVSGLLLPLTPAISRLGGSRTTLPIGARCLVPYFAARSRRRFVGRRHDGRVHRTNGGRRRRPQPRIRRVRSGSSGKFGTVINLGRTANRPFCTTAPTCSGPTTRPRSTWTTRASAPLAPRRPRHRASSPAPPLDHHVQDRRDETGPRPRPHRRGDFLHRHLRPRRRSRSARTATSKKGETTFVSLKVLGVTVPDQTPAQETPSDCRLASWSSPPRWHRCTHRPTGGRTVSRTRPRSRWGTWSGPERRPRSTCRAAVAVE